MVETQSQYAETMKHALKSRRLLCDALNKLFWKCRMPLYMYKAGCTTDEWAKYWLAELRDMLDGHSISGIKWNAGDSRFVPCRERRE